MRVYADCRGSFFQPAVFSHYSRLWRSQRLHTADRSQTQPEQSMYAQSAWRETPHEREQSSTLRWPSAAPRCDLTPASQVSLLRPRSTSFRLPAGRRNSPLSWINKSMVWMRSQSNWIPNDQYLPYLDETGDLWSCAAQFISWQQNNRFYLPIALYGFYWTALLMVQQVDP